MRLSGRPVLSGSLRKKKRSEGNAGELRGGSGREDRHSHRGDMPGFPPVLQHLYAVEEAV